MRVRFRYQFTDDKGKRAVTTYDEPMTCVPRSGEKVNFKDRQVTITEVMWNMDPAIPCDAIVFVEDPK